MPEVFAGLPVTDHAAAAAWYERLFGEPPFMRPHATESVWRLEEHAWVYVVEDAERAGHGLLTVLVADLDAQVAGLAERGLTTEPIVAMDNGVRTAEIRDADGNLVKFGQPPEEEATP
jgi:catechol 2,3-dioxygenase-like lactoylglutathione lyase family enzyme